MTQLIRTLQTPRPRPARRSFRRTPLTTRLLFNPFVAAFVIAMTLTSLVGTAHRFAPHIHTTAPAPLFNFIVTQWHGDRTPDIWIIDHAQTGEDCIQLLIAFNARDNSDTTIGSCEQE